MRWMKHMLLLIQCLIEQVLICQNRALHVKRQLGSKCVTRLVHLTRIVEKVTESESETETETETESGELGLLALLREPRHQKLQKKQ